MAAPLQAAQPQLVKKVKGALSTTHTLKKSMLRKRTDRTWFSRLVRHPARKRSGSILTTPEPTRDDCEV